MGYDHPPSAINTLSTCYRLIILITYYAALMCSQYAINVLSAYYELLLINAMFRCHTLPTCHPHAIHMPSMCYQYAINVSPPTDYQCTIAILSICYALLPYAINMLTTCHQCATAINIVNAITIRCQNHFNMLLSTRHRRTMAMAPPSYAINKLLVWHSRLTLSAIHMLEMLYHSLI